jgi:hypothetical protein
MEKKYCRDVAFYLSCIRGPPCSYAEAANRRANQRHRNAVVWLCDVAQCGEAHVNFESPIFARLGTSRFAPVATVTTYSIEELGGCTRPGELTGK